MVLLPALAIAAILVATAVAGFDSGTGPSGKRVDQEVTALLAGIPQNGATLGFPGAPISLQVFVDLECPTVRSFVEAYLPTMIATWVRTGEMKLKYRPLKTDTSNEHTFFRQGEAALAAGRQDRLWNFALTFIRQQGNHFTEYATDAFVAHMASQVPKLDMVRWNRDRKDVSLFKPVALSVHSAHVKGLAFTPSFLISGPNALSVKTEIESSLDREIQVLRLEVSEDIPRLRIS